MSHWVLPREAVIDGQRYPIHWDYREILEIISYLDNPNLPEFLRWKIGVGLFFEGQPPDEQAMAYLAWFLSCGEEPAAGVKLLDWEQDGAVIVAEVNKVAGMEIRDVPRLHWWTFLSYFHAIGQGQLSTLVAIRDKLHRGKKLEPWEQEFYRNNKAKVDLRKRYSREELAERERLRKLLDGEL